MKTPRFWYPQRGHCSPALWSDLLVPFSSLFKAGTFLRRAFAKPYHAQVPVVCVGNVVAGGAGKTPTALALAQIFQDRGQKAVFVTRGYGGKGAPTCVDLACHNAADVGDEALLLAASAPTWAAHDRVKAVREAETRASVIIMDDGLQNPNIAPDTSILVVDGDVGIGNGRVIPAGPLRESLLCALNRVAAMIIIGDRDRQNLAAQARVPVFRAHLQPRLPLGFPREAKFIAFAGIARPSKFYATARSLGLNVVETRDFDDHHAYSAADIDALRLLAKERGALLLTTEKDAVRLSPEFHDEVEILPVRLVFDDPGAEKALAGICLSA